MFVGTFGTIGAGLWGAKLGDFMTFFGSGMLVWVLLVCILNDSANLYPAAGGMLTNFRFPFTSLALICVTRNFIVFLHNTVVIVIVFLIFGTAPTFSSVLWAIPGMILLLLNGIWISLLISIICVRFRDVMQVVATITQVAMFVTPIFWKADSLRGARRLAFVDYNPMYHLIELVRAPLLGTIPTAYTYWFCLIMLIVGSSFVALLYARYRHRISCWI
jgi:ABC-type polysaccharide/polyol phosphate export permease